MSKVITIANFENVKHVSEKARQAVPNLAVKIEKEYNEKLEKALTQKEKNRYLTEKQVEKVAAGKKQVIDFAKNIINKVNKTYDAELIDKINKLFKLEENPVKSIDLRLEWRRGSMQALQCKASAKITYQFGYEYTETGYTGGCGYDKESTAAGRVFTDCQQLRRELCLLAEKALQAGQTYEKYIGYGSGYSLIPYFEGGVGLNCHLRILEKLGFTCKNVYSDKKSDVWIISR